MEKEKTIKVMNETGLHARPASQFVKKASKYKAETTIVFEGKEVNAKSIMGLMSLGISKGSQITLKSEGEDANKAISDLAEFVEVTLLEEDH
ncbi:phosphocarrier protein [Halanaerobium congolense]|jgi:phosphocarrier protein|uniref:Phosphocarrier protein HPr n=1 Tax=Halanaerobium congolense TaxID=54121 RepID=A0A1I0AZ13_9FIRM|nr:MULTISPECIES: HPr family phosphocarrier protein [Halanaerobium]PTX16557.1 phosphocarrier protein [Halanaerobium congolense]PUU87230.1 MAG: phosphocarrier protein [Halanaerobium sp.]SDF60104.1 phosphocarrier protein [Halanaerobium congolense]SES99652.1 phosphocarrier protein [Halanaerobium congolense]SFP35695.1 phosphocarrier protein [Halanaerobium congolense]